VCWKVTWFCRWRRGASGASPSFDACTSWIFLGVTWASPSSSFFQYFISSLSIPYTWKLPSYKTLHNSISNVSINMIVDQPFWFRFQLKHTTYKAYTTVATSSKVPWSKELNKKAIERQTQIVAEICQNRTAAKGWFFRGSSVAQVEKCKTNESLDITWGICTRNLRSKIYSENFYEFL
jgi:hypothetical protein